MEKNTSYVAKGLKGTFYEGAKDIFGTVRDSVKNAAKGVKYLASNTADEIKYGDKRITALKIAGVALPIAVGIGVGYALSKVLDPLARVEDIGWNRDPNFPKSNIWEDEQARIIYNPLLNNGGSEIVRGHTEKLPELISKAITEHVNNSIGLRTAEIIGGGTAAGSTVLVGEYIGRKSKEKKSEN